MSKMFDIADHIFPILSVEGDAEPYHVDAFLGTGFWINSTGHFLTCRHVFEALKQKQKPVIGQPFGDKSDSYIPICRWRAHPDIDIAIGEVVSKKKRPVLEKFEGQIATGLEVEAFGFMGWSKSGQTISIDARLLRGHVSRMHSDPVGLPARSIFEVSFPSPSGFSGTPLMVSHRVVGMLYGNIESKLQAFAMDEIRDGSREYREISYRILEFGLAHPLDDLVGFARSCGVEAFQ